MLFIHWTDKPLEELFLLPKEDFPNHQPSDNREPEVMVTLQTDTITNMKRAEPEDYLVMLRKVPNLEKWLQLASAENLRLELLTEVEAHTDQVDNSETYDSKIEK